MIAEKIKNSETYVGNGRMQYFAMDIYEVVTKLSNEFVWSADKPLVAICSSDNMLQFFLTVALWDKQANIMFVNPMNGKDYFEKVVANYYPQYILMDKSAFEAEYMKGLHVLKEISVTDKTILFCDGMGAGDILGKRRGMLFFTSGTTDVPKAVFRSEKNIVNDALSNIETFDISSEDKVLIAVPFGHVYGLGSGVIPFVMQGAGVYFAPSFLTGKGFKRIIEKENITAIIASPTVYEELLHTDVKLEKCRLMLSAGSKLRGGLIREFRDRFNKEINNMYGSSETGAIATVYQLGDLGTDDTNCGRPQSRISVCCNGTREENDIIRIKSDSIAEGIIRDGKLIPLVDRDGWLEMNDIGYIDEQGCIHLMGRKDDMINIGGEKLSAKVVETEIERLHGEVVVLTESNGDGNYYPIAFIKSRHVNCEELIETLTEKLSYRFVPRKIYILDEFPRNANGKIDRKKLKKQEGVYLIYDITE